MRTLKREKPAGWRAFLVLEPEGFPAFQRDKPRTCSFNEERPPLARWPLVSCGAGGVRTLVQTTAKCAFYMRSRFIGFRPMPGEGHPSMDLDPVSYLCYGSPHKPVFHDDTPNSERRLTGLSEGYSFAVLLFARIKPNGLRPLSCESVLCFAG